MLNVLLAVAVCTVAFLLALVFVCSSRNESDTNEHIGVLSGTCYAIIVGLCIAYPVAMEVIGVIVLSLIAIPTFCVLSSIFR
ncbi:MAG: hypothetical protein RLY61_308 [Candidatus Parcubacteria bacterium]